VINLCTNRWKAINPPDVIAVTYSASKLSQAADAY